MQPLVVRVVDTVSQRVDDYAFRHAPVRIGRHRLNDVVLSHPVVSQWHASIESSEAGTHFRDLGSTNGTTINGRRLAPIPVPVKDGEHLKVEIGSLEIEIWRGEPPEQTEAPRREDDEASLPAFLRDRSPYEESAGSEATANIDTSMLKVIAEQLTPDYEGFERHAANLTEKLKVTLGSREPFEQEVLASMLALRMPRLLTIPEVRELFTEWGVHMPGIEGTRSAGLRMLQDLFKHYTGDGELRSEEHLFTLMRRLARTLESFAQAFVDLRRGQEEFGVEMAVRSIKEFSKVHTVDDPRDLVGYLLDPLDRKEARIDELSSAYADIMIHQIALLNGMMAGVRHMLSDIGPDAIAGEVRGWFGPLRDAARWAKFVERHGELTEEDGMITRAVFGDAFAEAYAAIGGEAPDPSAGESKP